MSGNKSKDGMVLLPNVDNQNCFGCSPTNASGLKMKFYINEEMDRVTSWLSVVVRENPIGQRRKKIGVIAED